jgi:hypothetical protein
MGIFDFDSEPGNQPPKPDKKVKDSPPELKQSEMRKMSGFSDINEVARNAPASPGSVETNTSQRSSRRAATQERKVSKEESEKLEKLERQRAALNTIGKRYCKMMADAPYEMWARFAQDDFLRLTPDEGKELSDAYFELLNALEPDLTSPWVIAGGIVFMNAFMVGKRLKHLQEIAEKQEKENEDEKQPPITDSPVRPI